MDGAKGKPPLSTGKRQAQPISPQLSAARAGAGRPRQPRGPTKRARSDDEPDPEPSPAQVICMSFRLAPLCMQHKSLLGIPPGWQAVKAHVYPHTRQSEMLHINNNLHKQLHLGNPDPTRILQHKILYMQPVLLPLKKPGGKPEKNFKRPQARANGAPNGRKERAQPAQADPGVERCFHTADRPHEGPVQENLAAPGHPNLGWRKLLLHATRLLTPGIKLFVPGLRVCKAS